MRKRRETADTIMKGTITTATDADAKNTAMKITIMRITITGIIIPTGTTITTAGKKRKRAKANGS